MSERPQPVVDADSREFWEAASRHELRLPYCNACQRAFYYPRVLCPHCHGDDLIWKTLCGHGVVHSYTVSRRPAGPAFQERTPYVVALVDLEEGPRMLTNIIIDDVERVHIGQEVTVVFEKLDDGLALPVFYPDAHGACS